MHPAPSSVDASTNLSKEFTHEWRPTALYFSFMPAVAGGQVSAQEQAVLERNAALLTELREGGPVVTQLKQGTSVEVVT